MKRPLLMFVIVTVITVRAHAQESLCKTDESSQDCFARVGADWAQTEVSKTNTGIGNLASPSQSTARDFLSKLAAALIVPMSGDSSRPLAIDFNVRLLGEQRLKLEAVLAKPELSADVKQRLASNAAGMIAVKDSLSELDDVTVSATLDRSTLGLGRSIAPHRDAYFRMLDARFLAAHPGEMEKGEVVRAANEMINDFGAKFAQLLNNQPQLYGSVLYHARRSVAGPNQRSARVTYEMSSHNLTGFHKRHRNCASPSNLDARQCAQALVDFAGTTPMAEDPAHRLAMSVEYRTSNGLHVVLPEYAVNFRASRAHSFVYSLAYGRNNMLIKEGRLDLAVNYEDTTVSETTDLIPSEAVTAPPKAVRDRFVASATYTYKINDNMAMPLSLIYANHAAFLGDVDRRLNAHIGVTFKMR